MVIGAEPGRLEPPGLLGREHAKGDTGFHAKPADARHHFEHRFELRPVANLAPRRTHAKPSRPRRLGRLRLGQHPGHRHQGFARAFGLVVGRLRAIGAIFRAAAGFDGKQAGELNLIGRVMGAVDRLGPVDQIEERRGDQRLDFFACPVMPDFFSHRRPLPWHRGLARGGRRFRPEDFQPWTGPAFAATIQGPGRARPAFPAGSPAGVQRYGSTARSISHET